MTTLNKTEYPPELDELYPYSPYNNARRIVIGALERFKRQPSDSNAALLESYGICVDHSDADWGTGERGEEVTD